jgi:hypothetical protein
VIRKILECIGTGCSLSFPARAAVDHSPCNKGNLVLYEDVAISGPVIRVGNTVLNVVQDCKDTVDAIGVVDVLDEGLEVLNIIFLSLKVNPIVELHCWVGYGIRINTSHEDMI